VIIKIDNTTSLALLDASHGKELYKLANENKESLRIWLPWVDRMNSINFIEKFIETSIQRNANGSEFGFVIFQNGQMAGRIGVYKIDSYNKIGEIGYWLGDNFLGKGIATKVSAEMVRFAFEEIELNRIEIKCGVENYKSKSIPKRLGFKHEATLREAELLHGKFIDLDVFSLLKRDWAGSH
jgi:ribosomal-protein-serine acetyltransferase